MSTREKLYRYMDLDMRTVLTPEQQAEKEALDAYLSIHVWWFKDSCKTRTPEEIQSGVEDMLDDMNPLLLGC